MRSEVEATVSLEFESWGKLQLALAAGSQQMNLLVTATGAAANGSGGVAAAAVPLAAGSTATSLNVGATAAAQFQCGRSGCGGRGLCGAGWVCWERSERGVCELGRLRWGAT